MPNSNGDVSVVGIVVLEARGRLAAFQCCRWPPGKQLVPLAGPCAGRLMQVCVCSNAALYSLEMIPSLQLKERQSALEGN